MNYDRMVARHVNRFGISIGLLWFMPGHWRWVGMKSATEVRFGMDTVRYCTRAGVPTLIAWITGRVACVYLHTCLIGHYTCMIEKQNTEISTVSTQTCLYLERLETRHTIPAHKSAHSISAATIIITAD